VPLPTVLIVRRRDGVPSSAGMGTAPGPADDRPSTLRAPAGDPTPITQVKVRTRPKSTTSFSLPKPVPCFKTGYRFSGSRLTSLVTWHCRVMLYSLLFHLIYCLLFRRAKKKSLMCCLVSHLTMLIVNGNISLVLRHSVLHRRQMWRLLLISIALSLSLIWVHHFHLLYTYVFQHWFYSVNKGKKGKGSPYSITKHRVSELIPVLGSQPVTRQRRDCDLNPGHSAPESSTLTTQLPSHPYSV